MILPLTLYKKSSSMRLKVQPATQRNAESGTEIKDGAVFMTIAKAIGEKKYDVEHAAVVAFDSSEVAKIIYYIQCDFEGLDKGTLSLFHQYKEKSTKINIGRSQKQEGTYGWSISCGDANNVFFTDRIELHMIGLYLKSHYDRLFEVERGGTYDNYTRSNAPITESQ